MDKRGIYLQLYKRAPAPNRDYYGLTITKNEVILNIWNVTHGPHVFPKKQKCPLEDFSEDKMLKADIDRLFGRHVVQYCEMLSNGDRKLECMPTKIFLYILRHLATNDVLNLGQTSKIFFESTALTDAIYESDWLSTDRSFKSCMLITMTRLRKPIFMTIGKFTPLTFITFLSIARVAYSFFTVLKSDAMST